ncbi:hypothetical protein ACFYXS_15135 [Streptomyces sp. NPDC002574]|uniref:hypothetical protein n=1 Tax=Streptomyces sp. NPDC002574 TaxID=3364652 RepID=UPI0036B79392
MGRDHIMPRVEIDNAPCDAHDPVSWRQHRLPAHSDGMEHNSLAIGRALVKNADEIQPSVATENAQLVERQTVRMRIIRPFRVTWIRLAVNIADG